MSRQRVPPQLLALPSKHGISEATGGIKGGADGTGGFDGTRSGRGKLGTTYGSALLKLIVSNVASFFL